MIAAWCASIPHFRSTSHAAHGAMLHHLDKIPEAEFMTKVPTYAQQDHLAIEVPTRKHCLRSFPTTHPSTKFVKKTLYPKGVLAICSRALVRTYRANRLLTSGTLVELYGYELQCSMAGF
jgi:hypothetical protein